MQTELSEISLASLGGGAAMELFEEELRKALANIADPNTPWKAPRVITLQVRIIPNAEERSGAALEIAASSRLPGYKPYLGYAIVTTDGQQVRAYESIPPKQAELPGMEKKVIRMGGKKDA